MLVIAIMQVKPIQTHSNDLNGMSGNVFVENEK